MFRPITEADRAAYLQMSRDFYLSDAVTHDIPAAHRERTLQALLTGTPYAAGFLLEHNGSTAGYALLALTWSQEAGGLTVWVEELYVLPDFRGLGLGREFLLALPRLYPDAARLRLEVEPDNHRAAALYAGLGYEILEYQQMIRDYPLQNT